MLLITCSDLYNLNFLLLYSLYHHVLHATCKFAYYLNFANYGHIFFPMVKKLNEVFTSKSRQCFETFSCPEILNKEMKQPLKYTKRKSATSETTWLCKPSGLLAVWKLTICWLDNTNQSFLSLVVFNTPYIFLIQIYKTVVHLLACKPFLHKKYDNFVNFQEKGHTSIFELP